jgi:hypothetical protein
MNLRTFSHHCESEDWSDKEVAAILKLLRNLEFKIDPGCSSKLRERILSLFQSRGWSSKVKLSHATEISITAIKGKYGLCFQTGNMSRFYADLLKLQFLFQKSVISKALYLLPSKHNAKIIGSNVANYERMTKELQLFDEIITIPIFIIGID